MAEESDNFREVIDFVKTSNRDANRERSSQGVNLAALVTNIEDSNKFSREQARELTNLYESDLSEQKSHTEKLEQIRRSSAATELSFKERFDRFFTNNIKAFGSITTGFGRLFGANLYDRKLAEKERERTARAHEIQEQNYNINFLAYKFLVTEQVAEMREQTDLLRILVRRSPTLAQQEEDRMESRRRSRSFQMPDDLRAETLAEQGRVEQSLLSRVLDGLLGGIVVSAAPLITKLKELKAGLITKTKGAVVGFISRIFGLTKFGKVAGPVGAILGLIETGKDVFDIANAISDEDVRTKVMAKDVAGVVGSILGGALGFAIGGPVGAAVGVSLGNTIGGFIGGLMDNEPINEAIETVIKKLETQLETASGAEKKRIEAEIQRLQNLQDTDGQTLKQYEKDLEAAYAKRIEARTNLEEALQSGDGRLIAKADLALNAANKVVSEAEQRYTKFEKELEEKARKASDELLAEMMSFQDRFANSKNIAVSFFGRLIGGTRSDRGALEARRLELREATEELLTGAGSSLSERAKKLRRDIQEGQSKLARGDLSPQEENALRLQMKQFLAIANMEDLTVGNVLGTLQATGATGQMRLRRGQIERIQELTQEIDTLKNQISGATSPGVVDNSITSGPSISQLFNQTALNLFAEDPETLKAINVMLGNN